MIIDSHQHFWNLDLPFEHGWLNEPRHKPICRTYLPQDLKPLMQAAGVSASVFVQTQHNLEENRWALQLASENDFIAGVVGWVDLASDECEQQLQEFIDAPKFVGIRHITQGEPDDNFIVRPDVVRGLKILERHKVPFDLLFYTQHLKHAATLAEMLPELPMVIDHISKPQIRDGIVSGWREDLQEASRYPNVFCKLSGMVTEADWEKWKPADLKPYVETALESFGASRCMFGSDWPVCELAAPYGTVLDALREVLGPLSESENDRIFCQTAVEFYGLPFSQKNP